MTDVAVEQGQDHADDQHDEFGHEGEEAAEATPAEAPSQGGGFTLPEPGSVSGISDGFNVAVQGRIKVADEVVEKVAALAALEIAGVADLGGDLERAFESVRDRIGLGAKRANQGVRAQIINQQVTVDITIVIEYGYIVMEVATDVRANVARSVSHMLGMRVTEVNVTVDDVRLPGEGSDKPAEPEDQSF
ncbi:Asp23/Gls24 family envelope stress response protein [Planotetraspora kaengkrachanensis]|uniref:Asp23/Gls24 family envelope stress response protein n=1 Tax=Planotetraspora kaengkrachanensis TaxID=575193 RepID=A0A8J3Q0B2_9ACTN|nr:Asp23/Gls24 family envelope stress response protein [Planotetraspora kaengkrachanensis]GIG84183.1 hypothetical protein Pka01_73100 [Planotetraspora kaengkrachanensis]